MKLALLLSSVALWLGHCSAQHDVIIVGGGPAGLVAAEYLTRQTGVSVLLIEAGNVSLQASGGSDVLSYATTLGFTQFDVPGEFDNVIYNDDNAAYRVDWLDLPSTWLGKLLGGCSSINAAQYFRTPDSYVVKASWPFSASQVNAGFEAIEEFFGHTETPSADGEYYLLEAYEIVGNALESMGYEAKTLNDEDARNSKNATFGHPPYTIKDGLRDSPAKTFYSEMKDRENLDLLLNSKVNYIKQTQGQATAVVYEGEDGEMTEAPLTDRGVVMVAAGALNTPLVLLQSGIGPQEQLEALAASGGYDGVGESGDWVLNEAVGQAIFDAAVVYASFTHSGMVPFLNTQRPEAAVEQYMKNQTGAWAIPGPVLTAYETMDVGGREYDLQTTVLPHGFGDEYETDEAYTLALLINNPESRDYIDVEGDAFNVAANDSWYLSTPNDVAAMEAYAEKMITAMTDAGSVFLGQGLDSEMDIAQWVSDNAGSVSHHFGGSCYAAADDADDPSRCTDATFKVLGTQNVYVSDASLMKEGTVNPYGFVMYIGHQAAKNVLQEAFDVAVDEEDSDTNSSGSSTSSGQRISSPTSALSLLAVVLLLGVFEH